MAANTVPIAVGTLKAGQAVVSAANANRDGTGTLVTLYTAGAQGAQIPRVRVTHQGAAGAASTAMVCRLFRVNSGATTTTLIAEVALAAATPSSSAVGSTATFKDVDGNVLQINLGPSETLKCAQTVAESVAYDADLGGDY